MFTKNKMICMFLEFYKCGELHHEALLSCFVEVLEQDVCCHLRCQRWCGAPKGTWKKRGENCTFATLGQQEMSLFYADKVASR